MGHNEGNMGQLVVDRKCRGRGKALEDKWQERIARGNTARMTGAPREREVSHDVLLSWWASVFLFKTFFVIFTQATHC